MPSSHGLRYATHTDAPFCLLCFCPAFNDDCKDFQDQETVPDVVDVEMHNDDLVYDELDKENVIQNATKCRRDLFSAFTNPNATSILCSSPYKQAQNAVDLTQGPESQATPIAVLQGDIYSYSYGAVSLGRCCQPQICSVLLHALHSEHLHNFGYYRGSGLGPHSSPTPSTGTTNESPPTPRRPLQLANGIPPPYRTLSHFGFNSPRQEPRTEHKHLPAGAECIRYRPMQRVLSYEEIFATPRYEQLCQFCFEQLLRLKPELQRRSAASSSGEEPDDGLSGSYPVTPRKLATLTELNDEEDYEEQLHVRPPLARFPCHVSTQTSAILLSSQFLRQLESLNFSEESANVNYVPGLQTINSDIATPTSPAASATSAPPIHTDRQQESNPNACDKTRADLTEIWNFGNWQEKAPQDANAQQPLTERRITLEITEQFANDSEQQQQAERQLMSRDDRQRRKLEFHELWQDHVQYFGSKEKMEQEGSETLEHTLTMSLDAQEDKTLRAYGWLRQSHGEAENTNGQVEAVDEPLTDQQIETVGESNNAEPLTDYQTETVDEDPYEETLSSEVQATQSPSGEAQQEAVTEIPKILEDFEQSLCVAGQNLEKLVATTKKLRAVAGTESALSDESIESGSLFRAISLENIADADDTASVSEPQRFEPHNVSTDEEFVEQGDEAHTDIDHEEKRDDEKPVTPVPNANQLRAKEKDHVELRHIDEKDVDENEQEIMDIAESLATTAELSSSAEPTTSSDVVATPQTESFSDLFSPLERDILDTIEANNLKERESIFSRIDESIRNKLTPCKLQRIVSGAEETFNTYTHIYKSPIKTTPTPHLFQFSSEPRPSTYSKFNINAPASSSAHARVITSKMPRLSRSWDSYQESSETSSSTSRTSLERAISSTTFVFRSSPRKKRNFVQENIRNASKPRGYSKSTKTSRLRSTQVKSSDLSSVCTFQAEHRGSSARLWVSLPTSPRSTSGQKRRSASPNSVLYPLIRSPSKPFAKRRKPIANQATKLRRNLYKTVSSTTFSKDAHESQCGGCLAQNVSSTTFEVEYMSPDQQTETPPNSMSNNGEAFVSPESRNNATGSSLYYSADDNTVVELFFESLENASLEQEMEEHLYDNGGQAAAVTTQEEEQAPAGNSHELSEVSPTTSAEINNNGDELRDNTDRTQNTDENENPNSVESDPNDPGSSLNDDFVNIDEETDEFIAQTQLESAINVEEMIMLSIVDEIFEEIVAQSFEQRFESHNNIQEGILKCVTDEIFKQIVAQGLQESDDIEQSSTADEALRELLFRGLDSQSDNEPDMPLDKENDEVNAKKSVEKLLDMQYEIDSICSCLLEEDSSSYTKSSFSLSSHRASFKKGPHNKLLADSVGCDSDSSAEKSAVEECLLKTHHELQAQAQAQDNTEEDDNKPNTSARAAASARKRNSGGSKDEKEDVETVVLNTKCTVKDGILYVKEDESLDDVQAPRCENGHFNRAKPYKTFADNDEWNLFQVADEIVQQNDVEEDEDEEDDDDDDENENENELESDMVESIAEMSPIAIHNNMSPQTMEEYTVEVELPLDGFNEFGQLELELDTRMLFGNQSCNTTQSEPQIEWPPNGIYDFGPFIVELSNEQNEIVGNANANASESLEIAQNEINQATAQELEKIKDDITMYLGQTDPKDEQPPANE